MIDVLTDLCLRGAYKDDDPAITRTEIEFEWNSGHWVLMTGPEDGLWGWLSWYEVDDEGLVFLQKDRGAIVRELDPVHLVGGNHLYVATTVVTPWAPRRTYRYLLDLACEKNPDALSISAHLVKRDGRERYVQAFNDGSPHWAKRTQGALR